MGYVTKYGTIWGQVPVTSGRIYWVAPAASYTVEGRTYAASNDNDGLSPERAFRTVAYATSQCTASVGDVVVLLPGTHTMTAVSTLSVAGVTYTGIPGSSPTPRIRGAASGQRGRTIVTASASTNTFNITAADVEVANMHFTAVSAARSISLANTADRAYLHDLTFDMAVTDSLATIAIGLNFSGTGTTTTLDDTIIRNCYFLCVGAQGGAIEAGNTCLDTTIESCTFKLGGDTAWANAILFGTGVSIGTFVRDCDFLVRATGTTITDAIDVAVNTVDGSNIVYRCYVPVGGGAFNCAATADGIVVDSYTAGTTGTNTVLAVT
jgi:hypothetical protein